MSEHIARIWGTRTTYLSSNSNQENHILDIISNYSANQQNELNLKAKKTCLTENIEKVKELDTKILDSLKTELDQILEYDIFHEILVKIDSCLYSLKQPESEFSSLSIYTSNNTSNKVEIKLPKPELFKFKSDITMWQTFWDQFNSSIHSNEDISDVNKFNYLHSFICDEAREIISGIAPTSSNYKTAVDILQ